MNISDDSSTNNLVNEVNGNESLVNEVSPNDVFVNEVIIPLDQFIQVDVPADGNCFSMRLFISYA